MSNDLEVISHLVGSMKDILAKLELSVSQNNTEDTSKLKNSLFDISRKIDGELK